MILDLKSDNLTMDKEAAMLLLEDTMLHVEINYWPWHDDGVLRFLTDEIFEIHFVTGAVDEGITKLLDMLYEYAVEYKKNLDIYLQDQRRKHHLPYVLRALLLGRKNLLQMVQITNEAEIVALLESDLRESSYFWTQLATEKDHICAGIILREIRSRKIDMDVISQEEREIVDEAVRQEFERQMAERRGYVWASQTES